MAGRPEPGSMNLGQRFFANKWWGGISLIILCLAFYLIPNIQLPLTRAEAMYALIPQEMLNSGQWLTPTLNGALYLDKPPLLYWLNLLVYKIFGASAGVARLSTLAFTLGEVWITYFIGLRLVGPRAAWLGGFILLSSIGFFAHHFQILTDHLVTLALAASLYFLLRWQEQPSRRWAALFYLSLVVGFLSKGFIGLLFPILIGALYAWQQRQPRLITLFCSPWGLALAVTLVLPWFVLAEQAHPGFLKHHIINEQVLRFLGERHPPDINPFPIPGFWLFLGIWLMPWTVLLPEALYRFWRETGLGLRVHNQGRLLLIWPAVIMVFFTLSTSRIEYYSLPALAPLALVLGWRTDQYLQTGKGRSFFWGLLLIALLGLGVLFLLPYLEQLCAGNRREFIGMFTLIKPVARQATFWIPALALLGVWLGRKRPWLTVTSYGALALVCIFFTFQTLNLLAPMLSDNLPGKYLRTQAGAEDLVVMEAIEEFEYGASLAFYSDRRILMVQRDGLPQFPYPVPPAEDYIISPDRLKQLWQGPRRVFLLLDDATPPEPYLKDALVALTVTGKRLLMNRP
ncbi:MAG: glycosyltransferase family 39 protein [Desulfobaccales bacterium]|nr:glycosyltransferase family 39 protein [Desulfobaccales bacterium]